MINLLTRLFRPSLRQQLEGGIRDALRRYADRRNAPDLRVYVSTDLIPEEVDAGLWARDEAEHLRRFASQWAEDNGISRAGLRVEIVLLDTKREFAFVKPLGQQAPENAPAAAALPLERPQRQSASSPAAGGATLEVVRSESFHEPLHIHDDTVVGRKPAGDVRALGDRYMSARHARFRLAGGRLTVTDLDSKNRTYVNDAPLPPHEERPLAAGDTVRMGNTVLRVGSVA